MVNVYKGKGDALECGSDWFIPWNKTAQSCNKGSGASD